MSFVARPRCCADTTWPHASVGALPSGVGSCRRRLPHAPRGRRPARPRRAPARLCGGRGRLLAHSPQPRRGAAAAAARRAPAPAPRARTGAARAAGGAAATVAFGPAATLSVSSSESPPWVKRTRSGQHVRHHHTVDLVPLAHGPRLAAGDFLEERDAAVARQRRPGQDELARLQPSFRLRRRSSRAAPGAGSG